MTLLKSALPLLLKGALLTVQISLAGIAIGLVFGTILGVLNCNQSKRAIVKGCIRGYVAVIRGTPLFVQLLIIYFAIPELLGISLAPITAGIIALGINSSAYLAETIRGGINAVEVGQWDAGQVLGYTKVQSMRFIVLPQAIKKVLPALTNEFVSLIKESSILMILGVYELTKMSKDIVARELKPIEIYLLTALIYFALTTLVSKVAMKLEGGKYV